MMRADATRPGMNLGWFRAGLPAKVQRPHYSF